MRLSPVSETSVSVDREAARSRRTGQRRRQQRAAQEHAASSATSPARVVDFKTGNPLGAAQHAHGRAQGPAAGGQAAAAGAARRRRPRQRRAGSPTRTLEPSPPPPARARQAARPDATLLDRAQATLTALRRAARRRPHGRRAPRQPTRRRGDAAVEAATLRDDRDRTSTPTSRGDDDRHDDTHRRTRRRDGRGTPVAAARDGHASDDAGWRGRRRATPAPATSRQRAATPGARATASTSRRGDRARDGQRAAAATSRVASSAAPAPSDAAQRIGADRRRPARAAARRSRRCRSCNSMSDSAIRDAVIHGRISPEVAKDQTAMMAIQQRMNSHHAR